MTDLKRESGRESDRAPIQPGRVDRLSERVRRVTAPNPSAMTGPGTNTYLVGTGDSVAVIDPGPAIDSHIGVLLDAAGGRIDRILVTHTHSDHSPAAERLKAATGARLVGMAPPGDGRQDLTFRPDHVPADGERMTVGDATLRAIHTPGHASNQICYLLEDEGMLFTGDHIMQGSTVIISPPDGNMAHYLASLRKLVGQDIACLAPGHGFLIEDPFETIEKLLRHRALRERKILAKLELQGTATVDELVPQVYDDVHPQMQRWGAHSLLAHLLKLEDEGIVGRTQERWRLAAPSPHANPP